MKKTQVKYRRVAATVVLGAVVACSIAWVRPSFTRTDKGGAKTGTAAAARPDINTSAGGTQTEEGRLVQLLQQDGLINEVRGFLVEKKQDKLFINGKQLPASAAAKYLAACSKDQVRVEVYPFIERMKQHPDASFMQLLMPVMLSSPCVDTKPNKAGC